MTTKLDITPSHRFTFPLTAPSERVKIALAMFSVFTIWGSTYLAILIAVQSYPPFLMTALRYLASGAILLIVLVLRGAEMPTREQIRNAVIIGGLMLGLGTGGVAFAEKWVASGLAALAVAAVPLWAALFAGIFGRWPSRREWYGLGLGLIGVALLNMEKGMQGNPLGALALIIGPMAWAFASMWSRHLTLPKGMMAIAWEMLGGSALLVFLSIITRENMTTMPTMGATLALVYLITFGGLIGFTSYMYLLQTVRPALATSYAYVNPVVAVLLGVLFAGEHITPLGIVAMVVILGGVALVMFAKNVGTKS